MQLLKTKIAKQEEMERFKNERMNYVLNSIQRQQQMIDSNVSSFSI